MAEKQISAGRQILAEGVDYFDFRFPLKIDQHIAAENQVEGSVHGIGLPREIESLKTDDLPKFVHGLDLAFVRAKAFQKKPSLIFDWDAGNLLDGPDTGRSVGQNFR